MKIKLAFEIVLISMMMGSCNNSDKQALKTDKAEVISAMISYDEVSLEGQVHREESNIANGDSIWLNGCHTFKLKQLKLQGTGNNLTLKIRDLFKGDVYKREGIDLSKGITITDKDIQSIGEIEILQGKKNIFKVTFETSGCM